MKPTTVVKQLYAPQKVIPSDGISVNSTYCRFGRPTLPLRSCVHQSECQTDFRINRYCSEKQRCCQEADDKYESLCHDRRLPLFGEEKCKSDEDCRTGGKGNRGAVCKSDHCCPDFHYKANEPLNPPPHFYSSNYPCTPGHPIPPGFHFAFCSNFTKTIAYLGVTNKCGSIQHISRGTQCNSDMDCFDGTVCVFIVDNGVCFRNPEVCSSSTLYKISWIGCIVAFHTMLFYYLFRACYMSPMEMSQVIPHVVLQLYDVTKEAQDAALRVHQTRESTKKEIKEIRRNALAVAMVEEEVTLHRSALEYLLYWMGIVIDRPPVVYIPRIEDIQNAPEK